MKDSYRYKLKRHLYAINHVLIPCNGYGLVERIAYRKGIWDGIHKDYPVTCPYTIPVFCNNHPESNAWSEGVRIGKRIKDKNIFIKKIRWWHIVILLLWTSVYYNASITITYDEAPLIIKNKDELFWR